MSKSYIIKSFRVPESVKEYVINNLVQIYNKETREFFCHVLFGTLHTIKREQQGWVPVSYKLMKDTWGSRANVQWELLVEDGLIELKVLDKIEITDGIFIEETYSKAAGVCRSFRVPFNVVEDILAAYPQETEDFINCEYYNLMNGAKMRAFKRHKLTDDTEHPIPKLVKDSILSIKRCVINDTAIRNHLDNLMAESLFDSYNSKVYRRYINDLNCYNALRKTGVKKVNEDLVEYYPGYEVQMSGRVSEIGGGLQSCSRAMKAAAFKNIEGLRNYDLKSSQVWGLIQWFEAANLDTSWLKEYLNQDKQVYADRVGISKDRWKQCFMALIMGARLTSIKTAKKIENFSDSDSSIFLYLDEEFQGDVDKVIDAYLRFYQVVEPLKKQLDLWQDWLLETYIPLTSSYPKGKQYVKNKADMTFCISDYKKPDGSWKDINQLRRRISAFFLQGTEAAFIHHLTWVSAQYGYEVINNQHDGLVTLGEIPEAAVEYARKQSGLKYASLEEKEFI